MAKKKSNITNFSDLINEKNKKMDGEYEEDNILEAE